MYSCTAFLLIFFLIYTMHIIMTVCKFQYLNYKAKNEIILGVDSVYKDNRQLCLKKYIYEIFNSNIANMYNGLERSMRYIYRFRSPYKSF